MRNIFTLFNINFKKIISYPTIQRNLTFYDKTLMVNMEFKFKISNLALRMKTLRSQNLDNLKPNFFIHYNNARWIFPNVLKSTCVFECIKSIRLQVLHVFVFLHSFLSIKVSVVSPTWPNKVANFCLISFKIRVSCKKISFWGIDNYILW